MQPDVSRNALRFTAELFSFFIGQPEVSILPASSCKLHFMNNSAGGCSISIKFTTGYDHVTSDIPQTFKVNGSKVKVIA